MRNAMTCGLLVLAALLLVACGTPAASDDPRELTILTHDAFAISEDVATAFETEHNATLRIITAGDAGTLVNQAILNKEAPLADVLYGVDNTFLSRALAADLFVPYSPAALSDVDPAFILDDSDRVTPIDYGDVCINYDRAYFEANDLAPPATLADLTQPQYADLLVVQNPAASSPGLAFMLATITTFGEDGWLDYWSALQSNGVKVVEDWSTAYYADFSAASDGARPLVVSYASSPPAEVFFADPQPDIAPTAAIVSPDSCFRQIEFAGILRGAAQPELAQAWIDFMLSETFQQDIPLQMFVFPVNPNAALPPVFVEHAVLAEQPATLPPAQIDANRDAWLDAWADVVLR